MPLDLTDYYALLTLPDDELLQQCKRSNHQASGPGGQKRNRVYSAVRLEHAAADLRAEASEYREAGRNLTDALQKLRLAAAFQGAALVPFVPAEDAPPAEIPEAPPEYPAFRAKINPGHRDFPAVVLLALIALRLGRSEPRPAAERLGVTTSQLVKFLKIDKAVLARANELRTRAGRPRLQ